jgi:hypothetical protein
MTRLRKECDDLKAAEIRALKAKKAGLEKLGLKKNPARCFFFFGFIWFFLDFYVLFVHKKSVSKRKVKKLKKTQKKPKKNKTFLVGFFRWFFLGFFGWVFYCQPCKKEGELLLRDLEEGGASGNTRAADLLLDIKKEEDIKKEGGDEGEVDSKAGVLDAEGGSPDSGGTAEAAAAAAARMAELKGQCHEMNISLKPLKI